LHLLREKKVQDRRLDWQVVNSELRFPLVDYLILGSPVGRLHFPEIHGAIFTEVNLAWHFSEERGAVLGSSGLSFRMPVVPGLGLRLDWGRRFCRADFGGWGLNQRRTQGSVVQVYFGYNY
jgi:hypothetical protein